MIIVEKVVGNESKEGSDKYYDKTLNVTLHDGKYELECLVLTDYELESAFGRTISPQDEFDAEHWNLRTTTAENIYKSNFHEYHIGYHELNQRIHLNAKIIDITQGIVQIGEYKIQLQGVLHQDIQVGDFIEFDVKHLLLDIFWWDLYIKPYL